MRYLFVILAFILAVPTLAAAEFAGQGFSPAPPAGTSAPGQYLYNNGAVAGKTPNAANGPLVLDNDGRASGTFIPRTELDSSMGEVTLALGEIATTSDTGQIRVGDGSTSGGARYWRTVSIPASQFTEIGGGNTTPMSYYEVAIGSELITELWNDGAFSTWTSSGNAVSSAIAAAESPDGAYTNDFSMIAGHMYKLTISEVTANSASTIGANWNGVPSTGVLGGIATYVGGTLTTGSTYVGYFIPTTTMSNLNIGIQPLAACDFAATFSLKEVAALPARLFSPVYGTKTRNVLLATTWTVPPDYRAVSDGGVTTPILRFRVNGMVIGSTPSHTTKFGVVVYPLVDAASFASSTATMSYVADALSNSYSGVTVPAIRVGSWSTGLYSSALTLTPGQTVVVYLVAEQARYPTYVVSLDIGYSGGN
jgi:hypothetical protein